MSELTSYNSEPVYGTIADADVYLKDKVDAILDKKNKALEYARELTIKDIKIIDEQKAEIAELKAKLDEYVLVKLSTQQILQNLVDCGLLKEWYFNGKFNIVLKADDPHLQIKELNAKLKESENARYEAGQKHLSAFDMNKLLTPLKKQDGFEWLKEVSNIMLCRSCADLSEAFNRFFHKTSKHPKFKSRKRAKRSSPNTGRMS